MDGGRDSRGRCEDVVAMVVGEACVQNGLKADGGEASRRESRAQLSYLELRNVLEAQCCIGRSFSSSTSPRVCVGCQYNSRTGHVKKVRFSDLGL